MNFTPLNIKSHYSLGIGLSKPEHIARRAVNCGYTSCAITDHGSISGVVDFASAMKSACKSCGYPENSHNSSTKMSSIKGVSCTGYEPAKLKPIFGLEAYLSKGDSIDKTPENRHLSHLCVLAKNANGWKNLVKIVSKSNSKDHFYYKPRLKLQELGEMANGELIAFSGHCGSQMADILFVDTKTAYNATNLDTVRMVLKPDWEKQASDLAGLYQDLFGKGNFFLEIQLIDSSNMPAAFAIAQCLRKISKNLNIPCVGTPDSHYAFKEQATDQRILLCSELDTTLSKVNEKLKNNEDVGMEVFFKSNNYHIPSIQEMLDVKHTKEELQNAYTISEMCDSYSIENKPLLPQFITNSADKMFEEVINGMKFRGLNSSEYSKRVQKELKVLNAAGLADYFLIVQDYVRWAKQNNIPVGPSRGSCGGSLVAYLMEITEIDPIPPKLIFERFYNDGRNTKDRVALPDIDIDFSKNGRKRVIEYIRNKYGSSKVCSIATFNRMKGRGALKAVFSAYGKITFDQMNLITGLIPEPSKVAGELQETLDEFGEASIIEYAIENESKLKDYCYFDDNGEVQGELAMEFSQAMRLEDTKTHMGKHAAGIVISSQDLDGMCPMVATSKGDDLMCGFEMEAAKKVGLVKFDILGIAALDKLKAVQDLLFDGTMEPVEID